MSKVGVSVAGIRLAVYVAVVSLTTVGPARAAISEVGLGQTYTTIQGCINAAAAGDICNVHAGTYTEQLTLPRSGTLASVITVRKNGGDVVTVQSNSSPVVNINGRSYWTFAGLSFIYSGSGAAPRVFSHSHGAGNINYITISDCNVTLSGGTGSGFGIYIADSDHLTITGTTINISASTGSHDGADLLFASNLEFSGNTIYGNASEVTGKLEDGLVVSGTNLNIENNVLHDGWSYDMHPDGIVLQGDGDRNGNHTANAKVWRNTVYNFTQGVYFDAIHNPLDGTNLIADNVIYETSVFRYGGVANKMNGIVIDGENLSPPNWTVNAVVYNNTIDAKQLHVYVLRTVSGTAIDIKNNIFVNPPYSSVYITANVGVTIDYNYYSLGDPSPIKWGTASYSLSSFRSASLGEAHAASGTVNINADYTENPTSGSIGRGLNFSSLFVTDRAGASRLLGSSAWDIGAYVVHGQLAAPTNLTVQ